MGPGAKGLAFAFLNLNQGGGPIPVSQFLIITNDIVATLCLNSF